jgi:hypothetical protein
VILVILLAAMPYVMITLRASRPDAGPTLKPSVSDNELETSGTADINIKQNQSETGKQTNVSAEVPNVMHAKICIEQWRQELITMEDALHCIDQYMAKKDT